MQGSEARDLSGLGDLKGTLDNTWAFIHQPTLCIFYLRLPAGLPAFDAAPKGVIATSIFALLLSALGFFFSRLPLDIRNSFLPALRRLLAPRELSFAHDAKAKHVHYVSRGNWVARASL
jgi:hypothetical protein